MQVAAICMRFNHAYIRNLLSWESCLKHSRGYEGLYLYPELFGGFIHSNTHLFMMGGGLVRLLTVKAVLYVMSFILHAICSRIHCPI